MLQQAVPSHPATTGHRRSTDVITSALEIVIALLLGLPLGPAALASLKQDGLWRRHTAYLVDVLEHIVSGRTKSHQLHELLAWNWMAARQRTAQAAA